MEVAMEFKFVLEFCKPQSNCQKYIWQNASGYLCM